MTPERVEIDEPGSDHETQLGYYGGPCDGRYTRVIKFEERDVAEMARVARDMTDYTVTRYGVHTGNLTVCWAILMYTPILERGKL